MPQRLDKVTIALSRTDVVIPWNSRKELLNEIRDDPAAAPVVKAFQGAGTSTPVRLDLDGKDLLVTAIQRWMNDVTLAGLPDGLFDLRNGLRKDVYDAGALDDDSATPDSTTPPNASRPRRSDRRSSSASRSRTVK